MRKVGAFMGIKGIVFITLAVLGAILNFTAGIVAKKTRFSELSLKVASLIIVLISVTLLFIFGK